MKQPSRHGVDGPALDLSPVADGARGHDHVRGRRPAAHKVPAPVARPKAPARIVQNAEELRVVHVPVSVDVRGPAAVLDAVGVEHAGALLLPRVGQILPENLQEVRCIQSMCGCQHGTCQRQAAAHGDLTTPELATAAGSAGALQRAQGSERGHAGGEACDARCQHGLPRRGRHDAPGAGRRLSNPALCRTCRCARARPQGGTWSEPVWAVGCSSRKT
mmetsp:Transcript_68713/g.174562  ORF Transcript_68713/g.174562 Transcript_68713/m.174562 type:complete len:218 (+) Transcript_68713:314-967(+)